MKNLKFVVRYSLITILLTIVHHAYGAIIYDSPFRLHVVYYSIPVIIVILMANSIYNKNPLSKSGTVGYWVVIVLSLVVAFKTIGLIEGGYNHLVKNIVYFSGVSEATFAELFPPPTYEVPNDVFFEATGILQFFCGVYVMYCYIKLGRTVSPPDHVSVVHQTKN